MAKNCAKCNQQFQIPEDDLIFYDQVSPVFAGEKHQIPSPTLCINCRKQRRYAWRNEFTYYKRNCDRCSKNIISVYNPEHKYKVYCGDCYLKRDWDPLSYGREYDHNKSFFQQFSELLLDVPRNAMVNDNGIGSENCEYTFNFVYGKNCYLVTTSWYVENCLYVSKSGKLLDVLDCDNVSESELLHECVSCNNLYNCQYLEDSLNSNNCFFGRDLRGCSDCFCCVGLVQKQYHIFNKPYSKTEYENKLKSINLGDYSVVEHWKNLFNTFLQQYPLKASSLLNCEDCSGDRLANCRNTIGFGIWNAENVKYEDFGDTPKNSQDLLVAGLCQWCYESQVPDHSYQTCFTNYCWSCSEVYYSDDCRYCKYLFGCVGLRNAQYCIFNQQFTKTEYEILVPKIIESMGSEFGEYFPIEKSFFAYNETIAQDYIPLDQKTVTNLGGRWLNLISKSQSANHEHKFCTKQIEDVNADDLKQAFSCKTCSSLYKIPLQEINLRKKLNAAISNNCPKCRRLERTKIMNPVKLFTRDCDACSQKTLSRYETKKQLVYCQTCYLKYSVTELT